MKKERPSLDGFIPRRSTAELGEQHGTSDKKTRRQQLHANSDTVDDISERPEKSSLGTAGIRQSLEAIDDSSEEKPASRRERRRLRKDRRKTSKKRRIVKRVLIVFAIIILALGGYLGYKVLSNLDSVFQGDFFGLMQKQPLKKDANGRSNILIFGIAGNPTHPGGNLTDSIMVLSVDQEKKDAYMVSIPRDLWVNLDEPCSVGYQEKVNSVYQCGSDFGKKPAEGAAALQKKVGEILGLDIQYYAMVNFNVVMKAVDAVGGVEVTIESNPKGVGILDRNFDWECNYQCYYVKYEDGQKVHLDGKHALALSRARNASGGYGLADSNFDREKNQQKIIKALREKALSVGTLTNLGKVTSLMDALGDNLKTNIQKKEIQTVMSLASEIETDNIRSLNLYDKNEPLTSVVCTEGIGGVVCPVAGPFDYSQIRAYIAKQSSSNPIVKEGAKIVVLNGTETSGVAGKEADLLKEAGYTVETTGDAPRKGYEAVEVYKIGGGNTATTEALEKRYGITVKTTAPPSSVGSNVSFVIVIGRVRS